MDEDIENEIPVNNLQYSQGSAELRVKTVKRDKSGFIETKIERLQLQPNQHKTTIARPLRTLGPVENTICLSVEDVLQATAVKDVCWQIFDRNLFRRVLIYGKVVVLNIYSKEGKTCHTLSIDDGSGEIVGTLNISKETKTKSKFY